MKKRKAHPPPELRERHQWVAYRVEQRDGRATKVPYYGPDHSQLAKVTDRSTWLSYKDASALARQDGFAGVGFVFSEDDPFVGVDLDDCRDPNSGAIKPWARAIIDDFSSYTEVSPSGTGVHVIARGSLPPDVRHKVYVDRNGNRLVKKDEDAIDGAIEAYDRVRYFCFTGDVNAGRTGIEARPKPLDGLIAKYLTKPRVPKKNNANGASPRSAEPGGPRNVGLDDVQVLTLVRQANPSEYHRLFIAGETRGRHSEADVALACMFARHVGNDPARIARLMRQSALANETDRIESGKAPKWDRTGDDYLARTIAHAIAVVSSDAAPQESSERRFYSLADILLDDELLTKPDALLPHVAWLGRLTLFAGREKWAGKSTFLASATACISAGRAFLGHPCAAADVLWVSADLEHTYDLAERFVRYDADPERVHVLYPAFGPLEERLTEVEAVVGQVHPKLVVLDTLANLVRVKDASSSNEWPEALLRLKELARVSEAAVVIVHHTPKADEEEYRDSTAIGAIPDQLAFLVNRRKSRPNWPANRRAVISRGRLGVSEIAVDLGRSGYAIAETEAHTLERRICQFIATHAGATLEDVRTAVGAKKATVSQVLADLIERGAIVNAGTERKHAYAIGAAAHGSDRITLTIEEFERGGTGNKIAAWRERRRALHNER